MALKNRRNIYLIFLVMLISYSLFARDSILVLRDSGDDFKSVVKGLRYECEDDFTVIDIVLDSSMLSVKELMVSYKPNVVILLNNSVVTLYREYQNSLDDSVTPPPAVALMSLFVDKAILGMKNITGIRYEIPLITSVLNLPKPLSKSLKNIAVIHRPFLRGVIL